MYANALAVWASSLISKAEQGLAPWMLVHDCIGTTDVCLCLCLGEYSIETHGSCLGPFPLRKLCYVSIHCSAVHPDCDPYAILCYKRATLSPMAYSSLSLHLI